MNSDKCINRIREAILYAESEKYVTAYNWNETLKEKTVVAFGLGKFFKDTQERLFQMVDVKYLCDNDSEKWGKYFYGKKCISPAELGELSNVFVIIVLGDCRNVMKQLQEMNIPSIHISEMHFSGYVKGSNCGWIKEALPKMEKALKLLADDSSREIFTNVFCNKIYLSNSNTPYESFAEGGEYFENEFWSLGENEYFVDGGAYIGDTIMDFLLHTKESFGAIYSFEYEKDNYEILCKNVQSLSGEVRGKIEPFCCGIWDKREEGWCEYLGESDGTQIMSEKQKSSNAQECHLDKLDNVLSNKKVTILKLDIEGAEIQGILGAEQIIKEQTPKLAICLYHKPEDLWEIPLLIHEMNPNYEMIIKHHSVQNYTDTVLYAQ